MRMRILLRIWKGPDEPFQYKRIDAKEIIIKDGVTIKTGDRDINTCVVVDSGGIYHPVYDIWVN